MAERPLLIIDGDNLAHRAYHSIPKTVTGAGGRPINAVVGWTNMVLYLWESERPRAVFVGWDTLGVDTYRHRLWPDYQAGRQFDQAIIDQLEILPGVAAAFGFGVGKQAGYEADDLMAAAALAETARGGHSLILTTDRDAYQLVSERVTVLAPRAGIRDLARIGPQQVVERFGVLPEQVPDYKALAGDASDRIPGARGIGPKAAAALLLQHGDLEGVLAARSTSMAPEVAEQLRVFRRIVCLQTDVAVTLPPSGTPNWARAAAELERLGAENLARRLADLASAQPG